MQNRIEITQTLSQYIKAYVNYFGQYMIQLFWINIFEVRQHFDFYPVEWPQTSNKVTFLLASSTQIKRSCSIKLMLCNL